MDRRHQILMNVTGRAVIPLNLKMSSIEYLRLAASKPR